MLEDDSSEYDDIVTDHFRLRLMETDWSEKVVRYMKDEVLKRIENGQTTSTIKFEELYKEVVDKARDAISTEMEIELHTKMDQYISQSLDETSDSNFSSDLHTPCNPPDASTDVAAKIDKLDIVESIGSPVDQSLVDPN